MSTIWLWIGFLVFVMIMLALDLGLFHREDRVIRSREALVWTGFCAILSLLFCGVTYYIYDHNILDIATSYGQQLTGKQAALQFLTGWLIEQSLSLDNVLVIALIFTYFRVPQEYQHRVLFWGILGALVMRGVMILAGTVLIHRFSWITYVFGGLLFLTAVKLLLTSDDHIEPDRNWLVRIARRIYPVSSDYHGHDFFARVNGKRAMTPLFLVLLVVESTDVLFAVDSIPAIFAVTTDPFLVFTSNVFAILALRSLYFALAGVMDRFRFIKTSLVFVLAFVGVKMLLAHAYPGAIPTGLSLAIVAGILGVGVAASLLAKPHDGKAS
ncbi:MAG: TerC family protein [Planctomycetota bacterium]